MAITITIQGTEIEFPSSAASPNWAPAIIQFAQAVEGALASVAGTFDVPPLTQILDSYNPGINIDVPSLSFPTTNVRGAVISYSIFRNTTTTTVYDYGEIFIVYSPNNSVGKKWEISREGVSGGNGGGISFSITDLGQVQFTTSTMSGANHVGILSYSAKSLLQG